ncbi:ERBB receptor feedback inhibitor 1a [Gouania willdenowi]|uniref:ERBB receptor feedback inhibitor 1a n=1 Tax=Gouania willdenowi TaxID=441366 RepID=UPI0010555097|nr:ERBB receptor feedback inhibitor 1 [Gouania willdenowi]
MRPDCAWSMSTVGLTAQEISFPIENPFHRGSYCHSMAGYKPRSHHYELDNSIYFSMNTAHKDHSYQVQQKGPQHTFERQKYSSSSQRLPQKKSRPARIPPSCATDTPTVRPVDKDQVVPSFQKLSIHEYSSRCSKHQSSESPDSETSPMDSDEYFRTDDSSCLVANQCSKSSPFRYGVWSRRSFKDCGQINYAYYDGPIATQSARQPPLHPPMSVLPEVQKRCEPQPKEPPEPVICQKHLEKVQRKLRRCHSGPAGSLNKPSLLGLTYHKWHTNSTEKTDLPPPVPPRANHKIQCCRRWSTEVSSGACSDEDKPPKVPPRDPLSRGSSRTPSPKSLPMYVNGVMPSTQSFAPNPNYVSPWSLQRQNSEGSACIHPIIENGIKASDTHYYLMPPRSPSDSPCDCHARKKAPVDLV